MEEAEILVDGCLVLPMNGGAPIQNGAIAAKDGYITYVGRSSQAPHSEAERKIDAKGKAALPGLINCHTHVSMTLFRGMAEDQPLDSWLKGTIWPAEAKLNPEDIHSGALLGCLEMIQSGTTCFADMYFHEDMVAQATERSGLRAALAEGIIGTQDDKSGKKMLQKGLAFFRKYHGHANSRITALLGPHAAYSCSPELLSEIGEIAAELDVGVHIHLAESEKMSRKLREKYGLDEVDFLDKISLLKSHVIAAHCVNLTRDNMQTLSRRNVHAVYVPVANIKLGLGAARINELMGFDVNVGLGTDGPASNNTLDMFETMKIAALLQKHSYSDPKILAAEEVLKMATINGAEALGLKNEVGSLEVGKKADLILIDLSNSHMRPLHNIFAAIIYSIRGSDVDTVIVDGKILMENKKLKTLDKQSVINEAERAAFDLVSR